MKMLKRIISLVLTLTICMSFLGMFSGCGNIYTEEEHIQRITERAQKKFFNKDGSAYKHFFTYDEKGKYLGQVAIESFEVEILLSFDGKPECFLITFMPESIGVMPGIIMNNQYYGLNLNRTKGAYNPYEENNIEKGNRYYMWQGSSKRGFATIIDGIIVDLYDGHIYKQDEIDESLKYLRSASGKRYIRNYSWHI